MGEKVTMKTEIKTTDSDFFFIIPETFLKSLKWHKGDIIDIELVDGKLSLSKV